MWSVRQQWSFGKFRDDPARQGKTPSTGAAAIACDRCSRNLSEGPRVRGQPLRVRRLGFLRLVSRLNPCPKTRKLSKPEQRDQNTELLLSCFQATEQCWCSLPFGIVDAQVNPTAKQNHSIRGFVSGHVTKKLGLKVGINQEAGGGRKGTRKIALIEPFLDSVAKLHQSFYFTVCVIGRRKHSSIQIVERSIRVSMQLCKARRSDAHVTQQGGPVRMTQFTEIFVFSLFVLQNFI